MARVLLWMAELGTLVVVATLTFALLCLRSRSLTGILRTAASMAVGGAMSGVIGLIVGFAVAIGGDVDPVGAGLLATIVALPLTLWAIERAGRRDPLPARRSPRIAEPSADGSVAAAWHRANRLAPGDRRRLEASRAACAYVLHMADTNPFDMDAIECAVLIRKRLPELVGQTDDFCRLAARAERREAVEGMVADLERLGRMAAARVELAKARLGDSLGATRAHIASRTNEEPAL